LNIVIHNIYPNLELTSPVCTSLGATYCVPPSQQTNVDAIIETSFGISSEQKDMKGALLYKLQGKYAIRTDGQPNSSITSVKNTTTNIHLLIVWDVKVDYHKFYVCLIEFPDDFTWDEDKLWTLYKKYNEQFYENHKSGLMTWLLHGDAVMTTRFDVTYGSDYKLDIIISEGTGKYVMEKPMKINPKRLVLSLSMLIVLIYTASLYIEPSFKLNIHNQCSNIDLAYPTYDTSNDIECCRPPTYKVYSGDTMRSTFIIKLDRPDGALIYRLQRKQLHDSTMIDKSASNVANLLVIWEISRSKKLYADVLLVEHDKEFVWNDEGLLDLRLENFERFRLYTDSATETWSLDDNMTLMTTFRIINEDFILDITISEVEKNDCARKLAHIDTNE
jgi:hypothetical protein